MGSAGLRKLEWIFALKDRVSGPAARASRAVDGFQRSLRRSQQFAGRANVNRRLTRSFGDATRMARVTGREVNATTSAFGMLGEAAPMLLGVGAAALTAATGVGQIGAQFGGALLGARRFTERTQASLEALTGSAQAARAQMDFGNRFAERFGLDTRAVQGQQTSLLAAGFGRDQLQPLMAGLGDLGAVMGGQAAERAATALAQIRGKGFLSMEELRQQLGDTGLNVGNVVSLLARQRGTSNANIERLMAQHRIDPTEGIGAILQTISTDISHGPLGSLMARQAETLDGQLRRLQTRAQVFMQTIANSPALEPVRRVLGDVADLLSASTTTGKRLAATLTGLVNDVASRLFGGMPDRNGLEAMFSQALDAVDRVRAGVVWFLDTGLPRLRTGFSRGFGEALGPMLGMIRRLFDSGPKGQKTADMFERIGRVLGFVAGALVTGAGLFYGLGVASLRVVGFALRLVNAFLDVRAAVLGWGATLGEYLPGGKHDLGKRFMLLGTSIVDGLWQGLVQGWAAFLGRFDALVQQLPATVRTALGIASPSRVMMQLGGYTAEGFEQGLRGHERAVRIAMGDIVGPRLQLPATGALAGLGASAGGNTIIVQVTAPGGSDPEEFASDIAAELPAALVEAFRQLLGGNPRRGN